MANAEARDRRQDGRQKSGPEMPAIHRNDLTSKDFAI
jgi:hypothetical protein